MLKRFEVENFKGFKDRLVFDLSAREYAFNKNLVVNGIVNKGIIYGKNGIGMNFTIGDELSSDKINRCSMVTCTYSINGNTVGNIGILGPTRMEYAKSASLIREVAKQLSTVLDHNPKK